MIWYLLALFVTKLSEIAFGWLPRVEELPLGMDDYLSSAITSFKAFAEIFPPLEVVFTAFLWYLGFKMTLFTLRALHVFR